MRSLINNGSYCRLWAIGASSTTMRWSETVALGAYVFNVTNSPFAVSLTLFFRMIPMLLFGMFIGALGDRISRKLILVISFIILSIVYLILGILVILEILEVWHIYVGAGIAGLVWATDFPIRRSMIGDVLPANQVGTGLGLDMATSNFARVPGPFLAGVFLSTIGIESVYFMGSGLYVVATITAISLNYKPSGPETHKVNPAKAILRGLKYVKHDPIIMTVLAITAIMNLFAFPYQGMVPVIARDTLHINAFLLGILVSTEGLGATLGALWVASRAKPSQYTRIYFWGSIIFLIAVIGFSRVPWYGVALPLLFIGGFGMSGFATMQSIIVISKTPSTVRSSVLGVLAVTIGTGPIAALYMGALAQVLNAPTAVLIITTCGILMMGITVILSPNFLKLRELKPLKTIDDFQ